MLDALIAYPDTTNKLVQVMKAVKELKEAKEAKEANNGANNSSLAPFDHHEAMKQALEAIRVAQTDEKLKAAYDKLRKRLISVSKIFFRHFRCFDRGIF